MPGGGICLEIIADLGMARRDYVANTKRPFGNLRMKILLRNKKGCYRGAAGHDGMVAEHNIYESTTGYRFPKTDSVAHEHDADCW